MHPIARQGGSGVAETRSQVPRVPTGRSSGHEVSRAQSDRRNLGKTVQGLEKCPKGGISHQLLSSESE
jgi:hypothetical protein